MKKIKVLVIGANGFLGSHLVDSLIHRGYQVRAFDRYKDIKDVNFDLSDEIEVFSGDFLNQTDYNNQLRLNSYTEGLRMHKTSLITGFSLNTTIKYMSILVL